MKIEYKANIKGLSELFKDFRIYPSSCYQGSFVDHFLKTYPDNYYARDLEDFLTLHSYQQDRIGSDLPWWGKNYFSNEEGTRVVVISQDSNSKDVGSITFYANLMQIMNEHQYKAYTTNFQRFDGWNMTKEFLELCQFDLDYTYITDARKVYPKESIEYQNKTGDSEEVKDHKRKMRRKLLCSKTNTDINRTLLLRELKYCAPDLIVVLGTSGLELLEVTQKLTTILDSDCSVMIEGQEYYVAPFPSRANAIYEKYKNKATNNIKIKLKTL